MITRHLFAACLILAAAHAQSPPPAAPRADHRLRLLCVEAVAGADRLVVLEKSDKGWIPRWRLTVSSGFLADPLACRTRVLGLGIDPAPPPATGDFNGPATPITGPLPVTPFLEFRLPAAATTTAVLIVDPAATDPQHPYRVLVLDTTPADFGAGSILVQNLTTDQIAGVFGGKSAKIAPGQSQLVRPGIDHEPGMAQISLARAAGTEWTVFCDTRWPAQPDYRRYLLLLPRQDGSIHPFVMPEHPPFR